MWLISRFLALSPERSCTDFKYLVNSSALSFGMLIEGAVVREWLHFRKANRLPANDIGVVSTQVGL